MIDLIDLIIWLSCCHACRMDDLSDNLGYISPTAKIQRVFYSENCKELARGSLAVWIYLQAPRRESCRKAIFVAKGLFLPSSVIAKRLPSYTIYVGERERRRKRGQQLVRTRDQQRAGRL